MKTPLFFFFRVNNYFLILFLITIITFSQNNCIDAHEKYSKQEDFLVQIFKKLVEINTTTSTGNTTVASKAMAKILLDAGFSEEDVKVLALNPEKGNLIARYRGTGKYKPLLLLAHLDVVDVKEEEWSFAPFKLTQKDGYYYGRGTLDDKAMASIFIANMVRLKNEGYTPERDIIVCLTSDEENADINGIQWLLKDHRQLIDAEYCINEGGAGEIINGVYHLNEVQVAEKIYQSYRLNIKTPGGHSKQPGKINAIYKMAEALGRISGYEFPAQLNESTKTYFNVTASMHEGQTASDMKALLKPEPDAEAIARLSKNDYYNALLRTTCVATMISGGHAENALPQSATAVVNCRIMPDTPIDDVFNTLRKVVANDEIKITPIWEDLPARPSPLSGEIMNKISKITHKIWPDVTVIPIMSTGASDGFFLRNAGIPTYGVSGIFLDPNENRAHGKDERISKKALFESLEFHYQLLKEICLVN